MPGPGITAPNAPLVIVGATLRTTFGAQGRIIQTDDDGNLTVVAPGGVPHNVDITEIANSATVTAGVNGLLAVGGDAASGAVPSASYPVKIGAVVDEVLALLTDGRITNLLTDVYGRLHVRTAGFSELLDAIRVSVLNTIADDRDPDYQTWADVTDQAADTYYYPSAAGHEIGNRDNLGFQCELVDGTLTFEVSNDGAVWKDATANLVDSDTGTNGVTTYAGPGVTVNKALSWEKCEFKFIRAVWVVPNGTNDIELHVYTRAH